MSKHAVVLGAGVIGTSSAYFLTQRGWRVTLIDQGRVGGACSHANCGLISPSHVLPLAMPGAIKGSLSLMMQKNSPFYLKPSLNPRLWKWLYRFARRCNHAAMVEGGRGCHALLQSSRQLYDELFAQEGWQAEYSRVGCLFVYQSKEGLEHFAAENELTKREYGISAELWDGARLAREEPALVPGLAGAWYFSMDAHLRPDTLMSQWRQTVSSLGATIVEQQKFIGFKTDGQRVLAARTDVGEFAADAFVVATGALTPLIERELGCEIPIQPGKGYSISMPRPNPCPSHPILCPEHRLAITPMESIFRLGSTMEFSGYDSSLNQRRLNGLRESAVHYLRVPTAEPVLEEWYGWRPMTFDGMPIIDRCPNQSNVWIAAGHNMLGLSMAPATGRLVAELLSNQDPHLDAKPYRIARFG